MKELIGSPGTVSGLTLRITQCAFAASSIGVMVSAAGFSTYTAFWYFFFGSALSFTFFDLMGFLFSCAATVSVLSGLIINKILVKIMFLNRICLKQRLVNQLGSRVC